MNKLRSFLFEILILIALFIVLAILLDPFNIVFSNSILMVISLIIALWFIVYSVFIWKEHSHDERENLHIKYAGRISFLAGTATLLFFILIQAFNHSIDIFLPITLIIMVLCKVLSIIYLSINN